MLPNFPRTVLQVSQKLTNPFKLILKKYLLSNDIQGSNYVISDFCWALVRFVVIITDKIFKTSQCRWNWEKQRFETVQSNFKIFCIILRIVIRITASMIFLTYALLVKTTYIEQGIILGGCIGAIFMVSGYLNCLRNPESYATILNTIFYLNKHYGKIKIISPLEKFIIRRVVPSIIFMQIISAVGFSLFKPPSFNLFTPFFEMTEVYLHIPINQAKKIIAAIFSIIILEDTSLMYLSVWEYILMITVGNHMLQV